jgi:superfamily II DNA/RNA helicase
MEKTHRLKYAMKMLVLSVTNPSTSRSLEFANQLECKDGLLAVAPEAAAIVAVGNCSGNFTLQYTRIGTGVLADKLRRKGYNVQALHAGFTQPQRDHVINSFREGKLKLLVATDVAARGLDIEGITHIINFDVPLDALVYFHRIGRTARMGQEGTAITLVSYGEITGFNNIKALTKTAIEEIT